MLDAKRIAYTEKNLSVLEGTGRLREVEEIKLRLKEYTGIGAGTFPLLECDGVIIGDYDVMQEVLLSLSLSLSFSLANMH